MRGTPAGCCAAAAIGPMTSSARAKIDRRFRERRPNSLSLSATEVIDSGIGASKNAAIKLIVSAAASKAIARIPRRDREALLNKAEAFAAAPFAVHGGATPLRGHQHLVRLRQGDWRGICRVDRDAHTVVLETVAHRREVYR